MTGPSAWPPQLPRDGCRDNQLLLPKPGAPRVGRRLPPHRRPQGPGGRGTSSWKPSLLHLRLAAPEPPCVSPPLGLRGGSVGPQGHDLAPVPAVPSCPEPQDWASSRGVCDDVTLMVSSPVTLSASASPLLRQSSQGRPEIKTVLSAHRRACPPPPLRPRATAPEGGYRDMGTHWGPLVFLTGTSLPLDSHLVQHETVPAPEPWGLRPLHPPRRRLGSRLGHAASLARDP